MIRDIDAVMRLIIEAESLSDTVMQEAHWLLAGLSRIERLNVIDVAVQSWWRRQGGAQGAVPA